MWPSTGSKSSALSNIFKVVDELGSRSRGSIIGGSIAVFCSFFVLLIRLNLLGLCPYVFSLTRHIAVNLALSIPLWLRVVLMSIRFDLGSFLAHLSPSGAPAALNPFLCIIELVRLLVRPFTLAVRLTANLRTGHILIGLLGVGFGSMRGIVGLVLIIFVGTFYFAFEIAVSVIQSYIFTLLPTLYADEHP